MTSEQKVNRLIRSDFADIIIKVDTDVYHLDRLYLASKSDYFEKLLTEDFQEKNSDLIEFSFMDSDTFSAIVDVIYGKKLESVLTYENYVPLLMAMDYLQMEINLQVYADFLLRAGSKPFMAIFKLYNFVLGNQGFGALLPTVFKYLFNNLTNIRDCEEFLSLPLEHLIEIISVGSDFPQMKRVREICQIYIEWIWHDVENRLHHTLKIINAAKYGFRFPYAINDKNLINLRNIIREKNREKLVEYFFRFFIYNGEVDTVVYESTPTATRGKEKIKSIRFSESDEREKLVKYLMNGYFYDITIKVEGKLYKLHRVKLGSTCGYFKELFSAELSSETSVHPEGTHGTSVQREKSMEYSLDDIDRSTFDAIIDYIYFDETRIITCGSVSRLLKAALILKIEGLVSKCQSWMKDNVEKIDPEVITEIMHFTHDDIEFKELYKFYFCKRVSLEWPEMGNHIGLFQSLTFNMLEEILLSETLHFCIFSEWALDFCTDDHNKLLDICSKWVIHDVVNRYHLIPQVALAINGNYMVDYENYKMEIPVNFDICSLQFVRDKLLEILYSTSLVPSNTLLRNAGKEFKEEPVFISIANGSIINILNGDLDHIVSLSYGVKFDYGFDNKTVLSATMIDDNIFILANFESGIGSHMFFQVYNLSLKKLISLSGIPMRITSKEDQYHKKCNLLNCCNEIYCCFENGAVLKYLIKLNRWLKISMGNLVYGVRFASDGKQLYRMIENKSSSEYTYVVDLYNFELNVWVSSPNLAYMKRMYSSLLELTFVNGGELAALFESALCIYKKNLRVWHKFELPKCCSTSDLVVFTQCLNGILYINDDKLYSFSELDRNRDYFEVKKELQSMLYTTCAIHRPNVGIN